MHIDKTYSLQDIADKLKRPRTTLNNWYQSFKMYIPVVGSGRTKRFKEEAIDIFQLIMELKDRNEPNEIIEQYLSNTSTEMVIDEETENEPVITSIIKGYQNILEEVRDQREMTLKMYQESQKQNELLLKELQEIKEKHKQSFRVVQETIEKEQEKRLEEKNRIENRDREIMENLNNLSKQKEHEKPWYKKMFSSK